MAVFRYSGNWRSYLEGSSSTVSQDKVGNTSVVKVDVWIGMDAGWSIEFGNTYGNVVNVTCDGQTKTIAVGALSLNGSKKYLGSVQFTVTHNPEGVKTAGISLSSNMSNITYGSLVFGNASGSWSHPLPTIYRASTVSNVSGTIGSPVTINIERKATTMTHTVRWAWANKSGTVASNVGTSVSWTPPMDFCNDIQNNVNGTGTIYVDTYSGSTKIGTSSSTLSLSVPTSVVPTFTGVTLTDTNTAVQAIITGNTFVQVLSNIQVAFNGATGSYGSTISGYKAEIVEKPQVIVENNGTLGMMNYNGEYTIRASVSDSRGRWSVSKDIAITVLEYFSPVLNFTVERSGADLSTLTITRNAMVAPLTFNGSQKNTMTLAFKVSKARELNYIDDNGPASGSWTTIASLTNSPANLAGTYAPDTAFEVIGTLSDKFTSTDFFATVSTEGAVLTYAKNFSIGVGKVVDVTLPNGSVDIAGNYYAGEKLIQHHSLTNIDGSPLYVAGDLNGDWNNILTTGFYRGYNLLNQPPFSVDDTSYYVRVTAMDSDTVFQEAVDFNGVASAFRVKNNGTWTPWKAPALDQYYPIGAIYQSTVNTDPSTFMGGTWERFGNGRVLVGVDENDTYFNVPLKTGGNRFVTGLKKVAAAFGISYSDSYKGRVVVSDINTTSSEVDLLTTNIQPYITVYRWKRIG